MDIRQVLGLSHAPIAIAFRSDAPAGIDRIDAAAPSGCTYWKLAAEGRVFHTIASDHFGCAVGAYTHNAAMPPERAAELQALMGTMMQLSYLRAEEVAGIPRREDELRVVVYGPYLGEDTAFAADLVLIRGSVRSLMVLAEAAHAAGLDLGGNGVMLRPTCAMLPASLASSKPSLSFACIGNRVYTALDDGEMYAALPAAAMKPVLAQLETLSAANTALEGFHRSRLPILS